VTGCHFSFLLRYPARVRELFCDKPAEHSMNSIVHSHCQKYTHFLQHNQAKERVNKNRISGSTVDHPLIFSVVHVLPDMFKLSPLLLRTISETIYAFVILLIVVAAGLSCAAIISQAVRTSPRGDWIGNLNAVVVGASYIILVSFCIHLSAITFVSLTY